MSTRSGSDDLNMKSFFHSCTIRNGVRDERPLVQDSVHVKDLRKRQHPPVYRSKVTSLLRMDCKLTSVFVILTHRWSPL